MTALAFGVGQQEYWQYRNLEHSSPTYWLDYIRGAGLAPEQYRIGVKFTAWWLVRHLHWHFRYGFALLDLIGLITAVLLTYNMLERRPAVRDASLALQWFAAAVTFGLAAYYLMWVGFFFRPETLPSVGLTAVMAWLWAARHKSGAGRNAVIAGGLLLASAAMGWVRADIPCALNGGFFLISLTRSGKDLSLPRRLATVTSLLCVAVAAGTQFYIMHVLYPQATYGTIPRIMVFRELKRPLGLVAFLIFMLPILWTGLEAWQKRTRMDGWSRGLIFGSTIYLLTWIVMGRIEEVRIFIPFALALAPLTAELALRRLAGGFPPSAMQAPEGEA